MLDALGAEGGFKPNIAYTVDDITIGRALILAGLCVGIMGEYTIPLPRPQIAVRPLPGTHKPQRTIYATWSHNRQTPGITPMLRLLAEAASGTPR